MISFFGSTNRPRRAARLSKVERGRDVFAKRRAVKSRIEKQPHGALDYNILAFANGSYLTILLLLVAATTASRCTTENSLGS